MWQSGQPPNGADAIARLCLAVTVKEARFVAGATKYPPLLSPMLVKRTVRGMRLVVTGFTGPYTLAPDIIDRPHSTVTTSPE